MSRHESRAQSNYSRRQFLKHSSLALAGAAATAKLPFVHAAGAGTQLDIKIGLIGCGGRGTGAVLDALGAATEVIYPATGYHTENVAQGAKIEKKDLKVIALADLFGDRLANCREQLVKLGVEVPKQTCFTGFDAYKQLLAVPEVNYVILATPPHFRPMHLKAAMEAGKHVFMEKPAAVDVPGVKMVIEAGELAKRKGLGIAAGTQRRHMRSYQETIRQLQGGAIGQIVYARCYWNGGEIWVIAREPGWSDMEWQLRNWNYFTWLSGDHIVEQHVHNLDIMNWVLGTHPVRAVSGLGGRQVRTGKQYGYIFDHFAVEFEYPGGVRMFSQCRQINGCDDLVEEAVVGTGGTSNCQNLIRTKDGRQRRFRARGEPSPYRQEHQDLIASVRAGNPINEARAVAESTMTGIIGREAVYSGKAIEWDAAMESTTHLGPEQYEFGPYPVPQVAMPGVYKFT
jgi:myo-inositol 2-dehydrogenase/D-chiro-inositol 1-dehydrogenase